MKRISSLQGVPHKFVQTINKKKEDKTGKSKTKEFTSGKFFAGLENLAKNDREKGARKKPTPSDQLSSRKLKL